MVDVGVILAGRFGQQREDDWLLQSMVMVVVTLCSLGTIGFEIRR